VKAFFVEDTKVCDTHETKEEIPRVAKMKIKRKENTITSLLKMKKGC